MISRRWQKAWRVSMSMSSAEGFQVPLSLLNFLDEITYLTEWFTLGTYLELPREDLLHIEGQFSREGPRRCRIELFYLWMKTTPGASWEQLVAALKRMGENALAKQIRTHTRIQSLPGAEGSAEGDQLSHNGCNGGAEGGADSANSESDSDEVKVELDEELVKVFDELEKNYAVVVCNLLSSLEKLMEPTNAKTSLKDLQRYVQVRLDEHELFADDATNVDDLFRRIRGHYDFFNTRFLEEIVDKYFDSGDMKEQLVKYKCERDEFTKKANVSLLKKMEDKLSTRRISEHMPQVIFKLTGDWLSVTVARLQKFIKHIFEEEASKFTHIRVTKGCVCISWSIHMSAISALVTLAKQKLLVIQLAGVLRLTVGDIVIMEQEEDTVALPLLHATVVESLQFEEQETTATQKAIALLRSLWVSLRHSVGFTTETGEAIQHKDNELEYTACMFYTRTARNNWVWHFLVTKKLDALAECMRNTYSDWEGASYFQFQFAGKRLQLDLKKEYSHQGWSIVPTAHPSVITMDKCDTPQSLKVQVTARKEHDDSTAPYINIPVPVSGISPVGIKVFIQRQLQTEVASSEKSSSWIPLASRLQVTSLTDMSVQPFMSAKLAAMSARSTMSAKPTMDALISLKRTDGRGHLHIIEWITSLPYKKRRLFFGVLSMSHSVYHSWWHMKIHSTFISYDTAMMALQEWIDEQGDECTWEELIDCVRLVDPHYGRLLRANISEVAEPFSMVATATHELKPFNRPPQFDQLFSQVACRPGVQYKWREIGLQLDIPNVDELYYEYVHPSYIPYVFHRMSTGMSPTLGRRRQHDTEIGVIMDIFCEWKERGHPPYTWATILDVLKSPEVDEVELAKELEQWLVRQ